MLSRKNEVVIIYIAWVAQGGEIIGVVGMGGGDKFKGD